MFRVSVRQIEFKQNTVVLGFLRQQIKVLQDELGQEEVFIHAQKDQSTVVKSNQTQSIGADRSSQVGQDETITVGRTRSAFSRASNRARWTASWACISPMSAATASWPARPSNTARWAR